MKSRNGFTLIELLVIIIIISTFVFIALPKIKSGTDLNIKSASSNLCSTIKYLYNEAAFKKNVYRLVFDIDRGEYWIEVLNGNEYVMSTDFLQTKRKLPNGVHFKDIVTEHSQNNNSLDNSAKFILFLPTGFVEPAEIHLFTDNQENYTLQTIPYTGGTKVYNEYVELMRSQ